MHLLLNEYSIIQPLGNQSKRKFSSVYLLEHKISKEKFILKKIIKNTTNQHLVERLLKEAEFSFDHPQLPKIEKHINTEKELILIKKYVNGIELDEFWSKIKKRNQLTIYKKIIEGLIEPLHLIHNLNIVHCDLKPSNILIEEKENEIIIPHIIDFGLAIKTNNIEHRKTIFPLGYAAPELILNKLNCVSRTTDIFSLGIISWKLFCDKLPISHSNPGVLTNLQITYPIPSHPNLTKEFYKILSKATNKHVFNLPPNHLEQNKVEKLLKIASEKRYSTIQELYDAIMQIEERKSWFKRFF